MIVLIDGEEVKVNNNVKIIWDSYAVIDEQVKEDHLTVTYEGVIVDRINTLNGKVEKTNSAEVYDFFEILFG